MLAFKRLFYFSFIKKRKRKEMRNKPIIVFLFNFSFSFMSLEVRRVTFGEACNEYEGSGHSKSGELEASFW